MRSRGRRERGVALFATGIFLLAMLALAAIAIEVSRLTDTATEVQVVADAVPTQPSALEVVLADGRTVRVAPGFDAATLRQLLAVLEEGAPC